MDLDLEAKVAVITGGNTGIGLAIARALAREKARVVLCARDEVSTAREAGAIRKEFGVDARALRCDVTRAHDIDALAARVNGFFGGVDILINNAGEGTNETIMTAPDDRWQYYWDLHVMAAVRLSRALVPSMRSRGGGVILNTSSICARQPLGHEPIYNVTKAALSMLSKCMADELIRENIRVNSINPGLILTKGWENPAREAAGEDWMAYLDDIARDKAPIGRFATPEELADFFVFLCSPRASYCVGSTYYVDGGWLRVTT
jgi:NAD(P)-dependent dehydrogenase (short-subunit alcohol dehydrogenase family)